MAVETERVFLCSSTPTLCNALVRPILDDRGWMGVTYTCRVHCEKISMTGTYVRTVQQGRAHIRAPPRAFFPRNGGLRCCY